MPVMRAPIAAAVLVALAAPARADSFSLRDVDKQAHVAVSYALTLTGSVVLRRFRVPRWQAVAIAAAATMVLGTFKELALDDEYSWGDQLGNGIGTSAAAVLVLSLRL